MVFTRAVFFRVAGLSPLNTAVAAGEATPVVYGRAEIMSSTTESRTAIGPRHP
jgi:hypothetical protein